MSDYKLRIIVETVSKNRDELEKTKTDLDGIGKGGESAGGGLEALAKEALGTVTALGALEQIGSKIIDYLNESRIAAGEAQMAEAMRNAVFQNTNAETRTSIALLDQYAQSISRATYVDDDMVLAQEKILLHFRSLSGSAIPATLQAAIDMAGGFQGDVLGSTESLGRALELVAQGSDGASMAISTLRRQNIVLDADTRQTVITMAGQGKVAEAQAALLKGLSEVVGGQATAATNTMEGAEQRLNVALENQKEIVGSDLRDAWTQFTNWRAANAEKSNALYEITGRMTDGERRALYLRAQAAGMDVLAYAQQTQAKQETAQASEDLVQNGIDPEIQATHELDKAKRLLAAGMGGELSKAYDDYLQANGDAVKAQQDALAGMDQLRQQGVDPTAQEYQDLNQQYEDANNKLKEANQSYQKQIALMIYHNAAAHLDAKGQLELARSMGLISEKDYEVASGIEDLTAKYDTNKDGVVSGTEAVGDYVKELDKMRRELLGIPTSVETTVTTTYVTVGTSPTYTPGTSTSVTGGGQGMCFLAGTLVRMADGSQKAIEKIKIGDVVLTHDFAEGEAVPAEVEDVFHHAADLTHGYYVINGKLKVTGNHPLYSNGWKQARELHVGDELATYEDSETITSIEYVEAEVATFNLEVNHPDHNYFANGYLAHNKFASGVDFIVPPGYMGDNYPVTVQSGERVIVIPRGDVAASYAGQEAAPSKPSVSIGHITIDGRGLDAEELLYRLQQMANG